MALYPLTLTFIGLFTLADPVLMCREDVIEVTNAAGGAEAARSQRLLLQRLWVPVLNHARKLADAIRQPVL